MPVGWDEGRVAEVICTVTDDHGARGTRASGYRITADKVLTCGHAVREATKIVVRFGAGTAEHPSDEKWSITAGKPILLGHDLALLPIDPTTDPEQRPVYAPAYGRMTPGLVTPAAQAVGFPRGHAREETSTITGQTSRYRESKQATGALNRLSGLRKGTWELAVTNRLPGSDENDTSSWGGMSGAAVWVDGHIVGVVTEDVHPRLANTLTVAPLTSLWTDPSPQLYKPLTDLLGCEEPAVWDDVGLPPGLQSVVADHRHQAVDLAPKGGAKERDHELAQMTAFCRQDSDTSYWWWRAGPWSGKTALMATFATHAPPDLWVVSFFTSNQRTDRDDSDDFITATLPQLEALAGQPQHTEPTPGAKEQTFRRQLAETAQVCQEKSAHLVLLIDALDEEKWDPLRRERPSIASLLPATTTDGLRIIVSSRPNPDLPTDIPSDHPLRTPAVRHDLEESPHAREIKQRALDTLERLDVDEGLEWHAIALIAVAGSGLSTAEVAEIMETKQAAVKHAMARSSLLLGRDRHFADDEPETVYTLAHATLPGYTKDLLGKKRIQEYQQEITDWADSCSRTGWPAETPRFLLTNGYTTFLATTQDLDSLTRLALDRTRQTRLLTLTGSTLQAYEDIRAAEQANLDSESPDVFSALRLCLNRTQIENLVANIPDGLPAIYAQIGQHHRALTLAKSITDSDARARALAKVACVQAVAGHEAYALVTVDEIANPWNRSQALLAVARAQVGAGQDPASALAKSQVVAWQITDPEDRSQALLAVARAQVDAGQDPVSALVQGLEDAGRVTDHKARVPTWAEVIDAQIKIDLLIRAGATPVQITGPHACEAGSEVVRAQGDAGQDPGSALAKAVRAHVAAGRDPTSGLAQAREAAEQIANLRDRVWALTEVARAQVAAGRDPTSDLAQAREAAEQIANLRDRVWALTEVARAQVTAGRDPTSTLDEALTPILQEALTPARTIVQPEALAEVARVQAAAGHEAKGRATAARITDPRLYVRALVGVAQAQVAANQDPVTTLAQIREVAERFANAEDRIQTLVEMAKVQAAAGHEAKAQATVAQFVDLRLRVRALVGVAQAQVAAGRDPTSTLAKARQAAHKCLRHKALVRVLEEMADIYVAAGLDTEARVTAEQITRLQVRARVLIKVVQAQVAAGRDPTSTLAKAREAAEQIINLRDLAWALAGVAGAQVAAGRDPTSTLAKAREAAEQITASEARVPALAEVARVQAAAGHDVEARSTAERITGHQERFQALAEVAKAEVTVGHDVEARSTAEQMPDHQDRVRIMECVAIAQLKAGRIGEAMQTVEVAPHISFRVTTWKMIAEKAIKVRNLPMGVRGICRVLQESDWYVITEAVIAIRADALKVIEEYI